MSYEALVDEVDVLLAGTDPEQADYPAVADRAATILEDLAGVLRDEKTREPLGATELPEIIVRIFENTPPPTVGAAWDGHRRLIEQAGRVAANMLAEQEGNRIILAKAGYPARVMLLLKSRAKDLPLSTVRPVIAGLLNLTRGESDLIFEAISAREDVTALAALAGRLYTPGAWDGDDLATQADAAQWLWMIIESIITHKEDEEPGYSLTADEVKLFVSPLLAAKPREEPEDLDDMDGEEAFLTDLKILQSATRSLERFGMFDKLDSAGIIDDKSVIVPLLEFLEDGIIPPWLDLDGWEDAPEDPEKDLGKCKASIARTVVAVLAEATVPQWIWERLNEWFGKTDRPDLQSCALLTYGNEARSDEDALRLLQPPIELLPRILPLMESSTQIIVQHAVVGLLRNLALPTPNREIMGDAGVIDKLMDMGVWADNRDMIGSVQGGAIFVMKNLVRFPANTTRFLLNAPAVQALHALIKRTNDPHIALEGGRIWVYCARILCNITSKSEDEQKAWQVLADSRVVEACAHTFASVPQWPVLLNEAIVGLALLATFSDLSNPSTDKDDSPIAAALLYPYAVSAAEGSATRTGADMLASILAPCTANALPSPPPLELQANALAVVKAVNSAAVNKIVADAVREAEKEDKAEAVAVGVREAVAA